MTFQLNGEAQTAQEAPTVLNLLERFDLPTSAKGLNVTDILNGMSLDKKVQSGSNRWVMLEEVGRSVVRTDVPEELVEKTVRDLVS